MEAGITVRVKLKREMFRFESKQQWINKAQSWFATSGVRPSDWICLDAVGRVCRKGLEFSRAEQEDAYPVIVYEVE